MKEEDDNGSKYVTMKWWEVKIIVLSPKKNKDFYWSEGAKMMGPHQPYTDIDRYILTLLQFSNKTFSSVAQRVNQPWRRWWCCNSISLLSLFLPLLSLTSMALSSIYKSRSFVLTIIMVYFQKWVLLLCVWWTTICLAHFKNYSFLIGFKLFCSISLAKWIIVSRLMNVCLLSLGVVLVSALILYLCKAYLS